MTSILFLCSGGGGNLKFIYYLWKKKYLPEIDDIKVICDRECQASKWSEENKLDYKIVDISENQDHLLEISLQINPTIIITNIYKILNEKYLYFFKKKCINCHFSLLPSFSGLIGKKTVNQALIYGEKIIGPTIHYVSKKVDSGAAIVQAAFNVNDSRNLDYHMDIMFKACAICLYIAIKKIISNCSELKESKVLTLFNKNILISPYLDLPSIVHEKSFWQKIKKS